MSTARWLPILAVVALLPACRLENRPPTTGARERDEVRAVVARLHDARGAGRADLAEGLFWSGARVELPPGGPTGWLVPPAEGLARGYAGVREVTPVRSEVRLAGDRAVALVEVRLDPGTPAEREGTEVLVLRRVAGVWRITHWTPLP